MNRFLGAFSLMLLFTLSCETGGASRSQPAGQAAQPVSQFFSGDGGKGMSIAILAPRINGVAENLNYLPALVQGELVSNFSGFSAISVLDRQSLDEQYAELLSGYYDENTDVLDLGKLPPTTHILGGTITRTAAGYVLQMYIARTDSKMTTASYSGTCTFSELDNLTGIRLASLDLLQKMGVMLIAQAKEELTGAAAANDVHAQTALARGITAQKQGTEVEALSYFFQAAAFQPALAEAASRSSVLAANISSGNIGNDARNDIQWRKDWMERLAETEKFFNGYFDNFFKTMPSPYTLYYTSDIKQMGEIDYRNETLTLGGMVTMLAASPDWVQSAETVFRSMQLSVQAVIDGLNATGRKAIWGLDKWPEQNSFNVRPFAGQSKNFTIIAELVNSRNQVLGRQTFQMDGSYELPVPLPGRGTQTVKFYYPPPSRRSQFSAANIRSVSFPNVKANDITDSLTIRIASVNGASAETAAQNGALQIQALSAEEYGRRRAAEEENARKQREAAEKAARLQNAFTISNGVITAYTGRETDFEIPSRIGSSQVTKIGASAFSNKGLTGITIPNSVSSIEDYAFSRNQLTSLTIPDSVTSIGSHAFAGNQLTSLTIPDRVNGASAFSNNQLTDIRSYAFFGNQLTSVVIGDRVTSIWTGAFDNNPLTSITIGANVAIDKALYSGSSYYSFPAAYNRNGMKAGVYTYRNRRWSYSPR
ncbi:MAG: leucine-rich repeat domain-containing protein [Treponema sp.]|jgi:hypothetical protein|nr:leucine-rich repeat domain-containing protein [Treponema sp.]